MRVIASSAISLDDRQTVTTLTRPFITNQGENMSEYGNPPQDPNTQPSPYGQPAYGQQPTATYDQTPGYGQSSEPPKKGFFGALFDFKFEHFITPIIVKVVYVLALAALVLFWLIFMIASFSKSAGGGLAVLILGPIGIILYLAFIRMTLEFYLAIVRMSQDIHQRLR